jgi:hypothetical protein
VAAGNISREGWLNLVIAPSVTRPSTATRRCRFRRLLI